MSELAGCRRPTSRMMPVSGSTDSLADILERVLDKGIVIAGDIVVNVVDIELLTLKVRLLVSSVETARDLGIDWWSSDPFLSNAGHELAQQNHELHRRLERLEMALQSAGALTDGDSGADPQSGSDGGGEREPVGRGRRGEE